MMAASMGLRLDSLVPVSQGLQLYVLEWGGAEETDGQVDAAALVVMTREEGVLLALPLDVIPEEALAAGRSMEEDLVIGLSTVVVVPGMLLQDGAHVPIGASVSALLVDCHMSILDRMRHPEVSEEFLVRFSEEDPEAFPQLDALVSEAFGWLSSMKEDQRALQYTPEVTAESEHPTPTSARGRRPKAAPLPISPGGATDLGKQQRPKKPTTASLASSLETMNMTLQALVQRQQSLEEQIATPVNPLTAALHQPVGGRKVVPAEVAQLAREFPSPTKTSQQLVPMGGPRHLRAPPEVVDLEKERGVDQPSLADAMMAQSSAITTLVAQLVASGGDPMTELTGLSVGMKGAQGRAKLQAELASHKGLFFEAVLRSMARRMTPTMTVSATPEELMTRGVCGTKYLERFGGYGRCRDLGVIQHQVMTCMDFMQVGNHEAAKDTLALLSVMLEQATLDGGRLDLGQILTLADDPPASIFTNKQVAQISRAKAFSPLADQKWVTVALAYLKELETITSKRLELVGGQGSGSTVGDDLFQKGKGKGAPKKKPKKQNDQEEEG